MGKILEKLLKGFLILGGAYFIFDALLHFSGVKLSSTLDVWSISATSYANFIDYLYGSFVILAAAFSFIIQTDLKKYKTLVIASAFWALFHAILLLFLVWTNNYQQVFQNLYSLLVWLPFYKEYLSFNAVLLLIYSGLVYKWVTK